MREAEYQTKLIKKLERRFPGCLVLKNDSGYKQGIPDLVVLHNNCWALLEVKVAEHAPQQPNQDHYIGRGKEMSFAAFIYPENEEEVLNALQQSFGPHRAARVSQR